MRAENQTSASEMESDHVEQTTPASRDGIRPRAQADKEPDYQLEQTENQTTSSSRPGAILLFSFPLSSFSGAVRSCVACAYLSPIGELARIFLIGRGRRQALVNSAHVRADMHVGNGVGVRKRGEGVLL